MKLFGKNVNYVKTILGKFYICVQNTNMAFAYYNFENTTDNFSFKMQKIMFKFKR